MKHYYNEDQELVKQLASDNRDALRRIMDKYSHRVQQAVKTVKSSEVSPKEICQEVFVTLWEERHKLRSIQNLPAYLARVARNKTLNKIKANTKILKALKEVSNDRPTNYILGDTTEQSNFQEVYTLALEAKKLLPYRQKYVIEQIASNKQIHEIADELGLEVTTVKTHLYRARKFIREFIRSNSNGPTLHFGF